MPSEPRENWRQLSLSYCRTLEVRWASGASGHPELVASAAPTLTHPSSPLAMSSYLYIIKSELPLVIQTFLNLEERTS